LVIYQEGN